MESGPQAERSKRLQTQTIRTFPPSQMVANSNPPVLLSQQPIQEKQQQTLGSFPTISCPITASCHLQLSQLTEQKDFLTKYVERLLNQLRHLLQKHGELDRFAALTDPLVDHTAAAKVTDESGNLSLDRNVAPWMTAQEYVNPLFQTYDLKIHDLEQATEESKKAIERISHRAESLAKENSTLRQELEAAAEKMVLRMQHESKDGLGPTDDRMFSINDHGEYLSEINERIDVLMSENNMLMEQITLQDEEMNNLKQEMTEREEQIHVMSQNFNHATVALEEMRDTCEVTRNEKTQCEQQVQQYAVRLAQLEHQKAIVQTQLENLGKEHGALEQQLQEYEGMVENIKGNATRKEEAMSTRYQTVCVRIRELGNLIEDKNRHIEELEEQNRSFESELESVRQDCEAMLKVMTMMEKQLSHYATREDAITELEMQSKVKVDTILIEKEQILAREGQARREIARLLEQLRGQTIEHLKAQEEAVEQVNYKYETDMRTREEEIRGLSTELAQIRIKLDISARNQRDAEKHVVDAVRRTKEASEAFERKLKQLADRASAAEESKDMITRSEDEALSTLRTKEQEVSKLRNELRERTQELSEKIVALERELEVRRTEARELRECSEEKNRKLELVHEELQKVKADSAKRFSSDVDRLEQENRVCRTTIADLEYQLAQAKREVSSAVDRVQREAERTQTRLTTDLENMKTRVATLKDDQQRSEKLRQEIEIKQTKLTMQVQQQQHELIEMKEALSDREQACDDADRKISELNSQLAMALSKQQQCYRQERELRASIERLTLEKSRLEREAITCRKKLEDYRQADYLSTPNKPRESLASRKDR